MTSAIVIASKESGKHFQLPSGDLSELKASGAGHFVQFETKG